MLRPFCKLAVRTNITRQFDSVSSGQPPRVRLLVWEYWDIVTLGEDWAFQFLAGRLCMHDALFTAEFVSTPR